MHRRSAARDKHPKVYFEEWDEPMISGIAWVSELIAIADGVDIFPELAACKLAQDRITTPEAVIGRVPDIIIGSWCGKKFRKDKVALRPGFDTIPAVRNQKLYEIKSALIFQPGPAALTDGLRYQPQSVAACPSGAARRILARTMGTKSRETIYGASVRAAAERANEHAKKPTA